MAAIADPGLVLSTVARALGVRDTGDRPLVEHLHALLQPSALLLILDNLEQVLPAAADLTGLLTACPRLTILATSRTLLRVSGEHGFPAPPLPLPDVPPAGGQRLTGPQVAAQAARSDAVRLFVDRARAVDPRLTLTERNAADIVEICRRLDGLPLAIELAAARGNTFSPAEMVARLGQRLPLLIGGPRDQPPRLRTMRDAIAWGHDLLDPVERTALHRLAIFAGGFTLEAAEGEGGVGGERRTRLPPYPPSPSTSSPPWSITACCGANSPAARTRRLRAM